MTGIFSDKPRAIVPLQYKATAPGTGYSTGDLLQQDDEFDTSTVPPSYLATAWRNVTAGTSLSSAPTAGTYVPVYSQALGNTTDNPIGYSSGSLPWYAAAGSLLQYVKLWVAAALNAGSHVYTYSGSQLQTDAWTVFGRTVTKTYTWTGNQVTAISDWV